MRRKRSRRKRRQNFSRTKPITRLARMGLALSPIGREKGSGSRGQSCELVSTFTANPHVIDMTTGAVLPSFSSESSRFEATRSVLTAASSQACTVLS